MAAFNHAGHRQVLLLLSSPICEKLSEQS